MNDQQLAEDLRVAVEEQTPPPSDALADVMSRGRRRRVRQRLAAGAVAVGVLAGAGTAAAMIGTPEAAPPAASIPDDDQVEWPADGPSQVPYATWSPLTPPPDGREILSVPLCDNGLRSGGFAPGPAGPALLERIRTVAAGVTRDFVSEPLNLGTGHIMDVTGRTGSGGLRVHVDTYEGDPAAAAQKRAHVDRNCDPPKRTVRPDGTVLQLHPVMPSEPFQSLSMTVQIFRPDGTLYLISVVNYASHDFELTDTGYNRVGAGREELPLTEAQLAEIAVALVDH